MALPVRFAQLGLEDLADGGKRKRLAAQFDAARDLVARDQSAAVILDLGKVGLAPGHRNDDGMNTLAPAWVGDADDRDLRDVGMRSDGVFDFCREYILLVPDHRSAEPTSELPSPMRI